MRRLWRKLTTQSWLLSRWRYKRHGLELRGRPGDAAWYFAYGSNMHESVFLERRGMRPKEWRVGRIHGYRLRFNLDGRPLGKAAPANICVDPDAEVWGVLYRITGRERLRLDASEGVPGKRYRPIIIVAEDADSRPVEAVAYLAQGNEKDGRPSLRYISLLREGARSRGLPETWLRLLDSVEHAE